MSAVAFVLFANLDTMSLNTIPCSISYNLAKMFSQAIHAADMEQLIKCRWSIEPNEFWRVTDSRGMPDSR